MIYRFLNLDDISLHAQVGRGELNQTLRNSVVNSGYFDFSDFPFNQKVSKSLNKESQ